MQPVTGQSALVPFGKVTRSTHCSAEASVVVLRPCSCSCRLIATRGFLRLICQHLQDSPLPQPVLDPSAASCSQASLSQRASLSSSKGVNLLQVLLTKIGC